MPDQLDNPQHRRAFLHGTVAWGVSVAALHAAAPARVDRRTPTLGVTPLDPPTLTSVVLPALPYAEGALEPHVSATTLALHHGKHHQGYVDKTNALLQGTDLVGKSLEEIVMATARDPQRTQLFNNAAQTYNHNVYWQSMRPKGGGAPTGELLQRIEKDFGSFAAFHAKFLQTAIDHFSNGWVWLVLDAGRLSILDTHDADTPIVRGQRVLAVADVWEHAYYLDRRNARVDYAKAFLDHLLNWDHVRAQLG